MFEASTTSHGFPSWAKYTFVISLLMVIAGLPFFFFFFFSTSRIALPSSSPSCFGLFF
jgi:hypothetical protein